MLLVRAIEIVEEASIDGFLGSWSWRHAFMHRHKLSIRARTRQGQITTVEAEAAIRSFSELVLHTKERLGVSKVYNAEQTAIFFEYLPKHTISARGTKIMWCAARKRIRSGSLRCFSAIAMATSTRLSWWSSQGNPRTMISKQRTTYIAAASVDACGVTFSVRRLHRTCKATRARRVVERVTFVTVSKALLLRKKCKSTTCDSALGRHERALDKRCDGVRRQPKRTAYPSPTTIHLLLPAGRRGLEQIAEGPSASEVDLRAPRSDQERRQSRRTMTI
uniref:Uncharacterized protein AlNc14C240G9451 n=1 Tax=Albugo laibachii Nc14 TaxID=890382 RepID=F0WSW0_9STRA|nr:conserved hypothetical protein [Albugo laibachii Nc14]CCA25110.1 conserved hypothetical protein [Albugo laibachii Nc14]|eukprot:CCA25110.1 conserved hypothetical protein [Albugo laibachii Nc14]